ncbi:hypothetical protein R83H12_02407 [Fibrobacteria bacterium R8-3-H12]
MSQTVHALRKKCILENRGKENVNECFGNSTIYFPDMGNMACVDVLEVAKNSAFNLLGLIPRSSAAALLFSYA